MKRCFSGPRSTSRFEWLNAAHNDELDEIATFDSRNVEAGGKRRLRDRKVRKVPARTTEADRLAFHGMVTPRRSVRKRVIARSATPTPSTLNTRHVTSVTTCGSSKWCRNGLDGTPTLEQARERFLNGLVCVVGAGGEAIGESPHSPALGLEERRKRCGSVESHRSVRESEGGRRGTAERCTRDGARSASDGESDARRRGTSPIL